MRWQKPARVLIALVGIGCAGALAVYQRKRQPVSATPAVMKDQKLSSQRHGVVTMRTDVANGKEQLKYEADLENAYVDGRTRAERVHYTSQRPNGTTLEVWAGAAESQGKAVQGDQPGLIDLTGGVRIQTSDGLELRTDNATYDNVKGYATIPGTMTFVRERMHGEGLGATYDHEHDILWLLDQAHVVRAPDEKGEGSIDASAKSIGVARPDKYMNLRERARIVQPNQILSSDQIIVNFTDDERGAKLVEMHGTAHVAAGASAQKDAPDLQADNITLEFQPDGQTLRHGILNGKSRLAQTTDQGRQVIAAPDIDLTTAPDGRMLTNLQAKPGVDVQLPGNADTPDRVIKAASLVASGDDKIGLRAAVFEGGVSFSEKTAAPARGGRGAARGPAAAPAIDRTATSSSLALALKGQLGAIDTAEFRQNVVFKDGDMKASADRALHNETQGTLELNPAPNAKTGPWVDDGTVHVDAMWIQVDLSNHDLRAKTKIKTKMSQGSSGGTETRTPALFDGSQPVYGTGAALKYVNAKKQATFVGEGALPARVYQTDGANWISSTGTIEVDQDTGNLQATGAVVSTFVLEDTSTDDASSGKPAAKKASPPQKSSAGKAGAAPAPAKPKATVVKAKEMAYVDADRKATYTGEAGKPAELKGPDGDVAANQISLALEKDQRALKTLEASGDMYAAFEGGREAVGDRLVYDAVSETHVITGAPMHFKNIQNDSGKDSCTLEKSTELHYQGKDQTIDEPANAPKSSRLSITVGCDKPLKTLLALPAAPAAPAK